MAYKFKLNDKEELDQKSIGGIAVSKEWSKPFSSKPKGLLKYIRTRNNMEGIVDCRYESDTNPVTVYFDSERDCESDIILYHRSEIFSMPRMEQLKIAEMYEIEYAPYKSKEELPQELNDAQYKFEQKLLKEGEDITKYFSEVRNQINSKQN